MPLTPVAFYGLEVPPGEIPVPAAPDFPATFRITMAAIDPTSGPESSSSAVTRATLKIIRARNDDYDDDDEDLEGLLGPDSDEDDEDDEDDEEANGGPSDPSKSKKALRAAKLRELIEAVQNEEDSDEDMDDGEANGTTKSSKKGKEKATAEDDDEEEDEDEEDDEDDDEDDHELEEFVICTLDTERTYQQPVDITIGEGELVYFSVSGDHTVHLTGNYVIDEAEDDEDEDDEDDEDEYDLSPDEDELDLEMDSDEEDELDDLENPRITEVDSDEEEAPKLVTKGKNKRAAEEDESTLDELIAKSSKGEEEKLSKKQAKKLKNNKGEAVETKSTESPASAKGDKKVQFAKNLEQGPTGSTAAKGALGVKTIKGVTIDDRKLGSGPAAKKGDRVGMRYIGKLQSGAVFDSNKKGKPFSFKLGAGEVISGWDVGIVGMTVGGERRLTIPANMAYGSKAQPGIPGNSTLIFDVKLLEIK